jgi:GT2 family glycosyltransferase
VGLLREALDRLGTEDSPRRARLLSWLARQVTWTEESDRQDELTRTAVAMARRLDDPDTLLDVLGARGSILEHGGDVPFEVIVVDDASVDETRDLEELISGVTVVRNDTNRGFIEACNRGAAAARGEFVVFLNNDTLVTPGWLSALLEPFEEPDVGLVVPKLLYPDGRLQEAGGIVFSDGSAWNYGRGDDPTNPKYEFRRDVHYGSGACLAAPRNLFEELGGFDTRFAPMYYEDVDLAFAARSANRRVVYQPACQIFHAEGGTAGTDTASGAKRYQVVNQIGRASCRERV